MYGPHPTAKVRRSRCRIPYGPTLGPAGSPIPQPTPPLTGATYTTLSRHVIMRNVKRTQPDTSTPSRRDAAPPSSEHLHPYNTLRDHSACGEFPPWIPFAIYWRGQSTHGYRRNAVKMVVR